ncbi:MAG TPA: glutaredoxin domain-containing protein [Chthoniobacteraceae bacterium]|nr:glutaredoxin domain-containing protein [Chthoniobacteraceae bacterium]
MSRKLVIGLVGGALVLTFAVVVPMAQAWSLRQHNVAAAQARASKLKEMDAKVQDTRDRITALQNAYAQAGNQAAQSYKALAQERSQLNGQDAAAIHSFNLHVAAYQQQNAHAAEAKRALDTAQDELDNLLTERDKAAKPQVVVYTTSECPYCKLAKNYLAQRGVDYKEVNVEQSPEGQAEFQRLGGNGVPLILIGETRINGYNEQALAAALQN